MIRFLSAGEVLLESQAGKPELINVYIWHKALIDFLRMQGRRFPFLCYSIFFLPAITMFLACKQDKFIITFMGM